MATHSSIPAWRIPWTEEPVQFMGSQRPGPDGAQERDIVGPRCARKAAADSPWGEATDAVRPSAAHRSASMTEKDVMVQTAMVMRFLKPWHK